MSNANTRPPNPTKAGWRRQAGFSLGKTLVWAVLGFGLYTGWCFLPAVQVPSHIAGSVENFLKHLDHTSPTGVVREKTWQAAAGLSLDLPRDRIAVEREEQPGERIMRVRFAIPVTVTWLGSDRTLLRKVDVSHSYPVNESAEKARLAEIDRGKKFERDQQRIAAANLGDFRRQVRAECAKGGPDFYTSHVIATWHDGSTKNVPCDVIDSW